MHHILAITAGIIAGVAAASIGGPVAGFAGLVSVFLSIEAISPQNGAYCVWRHSDIRRRIAHQTFDAMLPMEWAPHCAICKEWRVPMAYTQINGDRTLCADCYNRDRDHRYRWKPIGYTPYTGDTIRLDR